ncbi:MAG: DUF1963 domain-containing protein, partial [Pseudomonadota bacterium]
MLDALFNTVLNLSRAFIDLVRVKPLVTPMRAEDVDVNAIADQNGRIALAWGYDLPTAQTRSFVGGYPFWPVDEPWPNAKKTQCLFLAQIDLSDLHWRPDGWPATGTLYFFQDSHLEDADGILPEGRKGKDGCWTPSFYIYFATPERKTQLQKPVEPYSKQTFFNYGGSGYYIGGQLIEPYFHRYCLPRAALRFCSFTEFNAGVWFEQKKQEAGLGFTEAYAMFGEALNRAHIELSNRTAVGKEKAYASFERRPSEHLEDSTISIHSGGIPHIDTEGRIKQLPSDERTFSSVRNVTAKHPCFTQWPHTGGMVYYHAMQVAHCQHRHSKSHDIAPMVQWVTSEAQTWLAWAHRRMTKVLTEYERNRYLSWVRKSFGATITVYEEGWRLRFEQSIKEGTLRGLEDEAAQAKDVAYQLVQLYPSTRYGVTILTPEQVTELPKELETVYLRACLGGQLFGWGNNVQGEVTRNRTHFFLAEIY